jgi:hypothetical protein
MMLNETDWRVYCEDRYVALCCTGLAESGDLVRGAFVVMTSQLSSRSRIFLRVYKLISSVIQVIPYVMRLDSSLQHSQVSLIIILNLPYHVLAQPTEYLKPILILFCVFCVPSGHFLQVSPKNCLLFFSHTRYMPSVPLNLVWLKWLYSVGSNQNHFPLEDQNIMVWRNIKTTKDALAFWVKCRN